MITRGQITSLPLGYNAHGCKTTLFSQRQGDGTIAHTIRIEPRRLGEQQQTVAGLTDENLLAIAKLVSGGAS